MIVDQPDPVASSSDAASEFLRRGLALLFDDRPGACSEGVAAVLQSAADGYGPACCKAALLAVAGIGQPVDWAAALRHLERGARLGWEDALGQLQALATQSARPIRRADIGTLCSDIDLDLWATPPQRTVLTETPRLRTASAVAPAAVCAWLIERGRTLAQRAETLDPATGAPLLGADRTHRAAVLDFANLDVVTVLLRNRIAAMMGVPTPALETSQILHYQPGERFAPHYDFLDPQTEGFQRQLSTAGQRIATVLVYLNDDYTGGETSFPRIALHHRGRAGDALMFANIDRDSRVDLLTLHAGEQPATGEKWVFSQWIRDRARI